MHALDDFEIDTLANTLFGNKFKGIFSANESFEFKPGYYIINTDTKSGKGIRWTALILTAKTAYMYDSFARDPKNLQTEKIQNKGGHHKLAESSCKPNL